MPDPAAPNVKKGSRSAANSRAVNRDLTYDQYVIEPGCALGRPGSYPRHALTKHHVQQVADAVKPLPQVVGAVPSLTEAHAPGRHLHDHEHRWTIVGRTRINTAIEIQDQEVG